MQTDYFQDSFPDEGDKPYIIDLFSGCGGLSMGFHSAGFEIAFGIDLDKSASQTAASNFHWQQYACESSHIQGDIAEIDIVSVQNRLTNSGCIVIGGPPCQAYSQAGRGKLRSLGEDRVHTNDARGFLYLEFLKKAYALNARCVVVENVPEAVSFGNINVPDEICRDLILHGYVATWTILNSADYGVPQIRERIFVIGWKNSEGLQPQFPIPTNRAVDFQIQSKQKYKKNNESEYFVMPPEPNKKAKPWVTVGEALSDLPELFKTSNSKYIPYDNYEVKNYRTEPLNEFQIKMRNWPGMYNHKAVAGHGFRKTTRDFQIFERMQPGDNYIFASKIADMIFAEKIKKAGGKESITHEQYMILKKNTIPPYARDKFQDKWRRLDPQKPSHTLVAHLGIDTYSHIHPFEPRGISVREAARLQSFPDSFNFPGNMGDAFKQIGNAVPPLLSRAVAEVIADQLNGAINK